MMKIISLLLAAALYASHVSADSSGNRQCPGGYSHGSQMDVGRYWYECRDGQMTPKGCLAEDGRRVDIGGTFDTDDTRMQCVLGSDGFLTVLNKACVLRGGEHDVGSQWDDGTAFYTCVKEGINVRVVMLGCVDQGRPMKFDERVAKGDFVYQCWKSTDGTPKMNKVGCVNEGRKYNIGETFEDPKFWYTCTDKGPSITGCMFQSHRLGEGDIFTQDETMYTCSVTTDGAEYKPYGCMARVEGASIQRKIGCKWSEGDFEYTCMVDSKNKVVRAQTHCVYSAPGHGSFKVQPGCVALAGEVAVGCKESGEGRLRMETYSADQIDRLPGLRRC